MKTTTMSQDGSATMAALFMKSNTISNLRAIAGVLVLMIAGATQAASTGFNQTAAGPYDYNTAGNWVSSTINGIWDTSLTLTAAQTVTFATDTALGTGLTFNYAGNFALTNQASGAGPKTITLGGDISLNTSGGTTANVTIGNDTNHLNVDLGGLTRTMTVAASRTLTLMDVVSNGGIAKAGSGTLTLSGNNSYSSGTTISAGTLVANSGTAFGTGKVTVSGSSTLNFLPSLTFTNDIEVNAALSVKDIMTTVTNNTLTFTGVLSGSGAISVVNNGQSAAKGEFAFTNPNNTWTGDFIMPSGNAVGYDQFSFSSIGDGGKFTLQKAGNQNMIFYTGSSNITFNSRVLNLGAISGMMDGGGVTPVNRFANYGSGTVTFNTDLTVAGVGTSTAGTYLFFGGTNTGINTFAGIIPNSTSGNNLGIGKSDSGKWILTRDNTFLGNIKVSGGTAREGAHHRSGPPEYHGHPRVHGQYRFDHR
jgi:autotransporter-associated beta strand protein